MASNGRTLQDEDGDYSDWIEIFNTGPAAEDTLRWCLTDDALKLDKWRMPSTNLPPGGHLVVFASGKDRHVSGLPFHTNFKLDNAGEYLGLVRSDGRTVASDFSPTYPPQASGISYGVPMRRTTSIIVPLATSARVTEASGSAASEDWTGPEYDDSSWTPVTTAVGAAKTDGALKVIAVLADSVSAFSDVQGQGGWYYGYYQRTRDPDGIYAVADFKPFPRSNVVYGPENYWNGSSWSFYPTNNPLRVEIAERLMRASGVNSGLETWPIRRWVCPKHQEKVRLRWTIQKLSGAGTGVTARLYLNGGLLASAVIAANNVAEIPRTNTVDVLEAGDTVDLMVLPQGIGGATDDRGDIVAMSVIADASVDYSSLLNTDLGNAWAPASNSTLLRIPFQINDPSQWSLLDLRLRFRDGFRAFLNGVQVAEENAPSEDGTTSVIARSADDAALAEHYDLSPFAGALQAGTNILGLQVWSADAGRGFLASAELVGAQVALEAGGRRYFSPPTPGAVNGFGNTRLGPLVLDVTHSPEPLLLGQPLLVTARIVRTFEAPSDVSLIYRAMYAAEQTIPMYDDGLHGDGAAADGVYGAWIGANTALPGQMLRYAVIATDLSGDTYRAPLYDDPLNSPQYFGAVVPDPSLTNALPVLHWFMQTPTQADGTSGGRCSVYYQGEFYDNVRAYLHGQSSSAFPKKSYNFDFNSGFKFRYSQDQSPVSKFNLLTTYADKTHMRNMLSYDAFKIAGSPYHLVFAMRVQRNGLFYSDATFVEDGDEDYLARLGLDPQGALYKMYNTLNSATSGAEKKTRKTENNADLQVLVNGSKLTGTASAQFIFDNVDLPEMVDYLAGLVITSNSDFGHKNYYVYRDTRGTGLWKMLPWDVDLSWGHNYTSAKNYFDDTVFVTNPLFTSNGNVLIDALNVNSTFRQMYLRRVRSLMDTYLQPTNTPPEQLIVERRVRELAAQIAPDAALDYAKWASWGTRQTLPQALAILTNQYMPGRRNYLFKSQTTPSGQIPTTQPATASLAIGKVEVTPDSGNQAEEYIQILNRNTYAVDLTGWRVTGAVQHEFAPGTVIASGGAALYLTPNPVAFRARKVAPMRGQGLFIQGSYRSELSSRGGSITLQTDTGRIVATNTFTGVVSLAQNYIRITELQFHPLPRSQAGSPWTSADFEYLVLKNVGAAAVELGGCAFVRGIDFRFPTNANTTTRLEPSQRLVLARNPEAFVSRHGSGIPVIGGYAGSLNNGGELLRLNDARGEPILEFAFDPGWFPLAYQFGVPYVVTSETAPWSAWGEKGSWKPASNFENDPPAAWKGRHFTPEELGDSSICGDGADPDGDGFTNLQEYLAGTDPKKSESRLMIESVVVTDPILGLGKLRFQGAAGRSYSVQYCDDLAGGASWTKSRDILERSQDGLVEASVSFAPSTHARYFRLVTPREP